MLGAAEGEPHCGRAVFALQANGMQLVPEAIVASGCSGASQRHTLSLVNQTGLDDTFTLAYDVSTLNGLLTGPASVTVVDGSAVDFEVILTLELCLSAVDIVGTVTATGSSGSDVTTITSDVATHELVSIGLSAPTWAGVGHPVDACTAQNAGNEWVTYLIGDTNGTLIGFWGYNHDTNSWFEPTTTGTPTDRWAPDWAYDPGSNLCYLTGRGDHPGRR